MTRIFCALLLSCLPLAAADDALAIIQKAFEADQANDEIARSYTFHERVEETMFDKEGEIKKQESKTWDVTLLDGSEYRRLIAMDGEPLPPEKAAKEEKKLQKSLEKMRSEDAKEREKRLRNIEEEREQERRFIREITRAFDFRLAGEEIINGTPCHVIEADPKPGYEPSFGKAKVLEKVRGTLWIGKRDYAWVRAEVDTIDKFTWGLFLFKLREGAQIKFEQQRVNDEVWLPVGWDVRAEGRAALVAKFDARITGSYSNFRKFSTESSVEFGEPVE